MRKGTKKNNVTLREKALSNGNISLYLDIYRDGVRVKEYLKLYIVKKPKNTFERQQNKETLQLAEKRVNLLTQSILAKAFSGELTAEWREQHQDLITGVNSVESLLAKIQAEREASKPVKKAKKVK